MYSHFFLILQFSKFYRLTGDVLNRKDLRDWTSAAKYLSLMLVQLDSLLKALVAQGFAESLKQYPSREEYSLTFAVQFDFQQYHQMTPFSKINYLLQCSPLRSTFVCKMQTAFVTGKQTLQVLSFR